MRTSKVLAVALTSALLVTNLGVAAMAETASEGQKQEQGFEVGAELPDVTVSDDLDIDNGYLIDAASPSDADKDVDSDKNEGLEEEPTLEEDVEIPTTLKGEHMLLASSSDATEVSNESELTEAVKKNGTIIIKEDIGLSNAIVINEKNIIIKSDGARLYCSDKFMSERMLKVINHSDVTLMDIEIDATKLMRENDYESEYFAVEIFGDSKFIIEEGTSIISDPQIADSKIYNKGGVLISAKGQMNGGNISGFPKQGVMVGEEGTFEFNQGEITNIINNENKESGGGGITNNGNVTVFGGTISDCFVGIFNNNNVTIENGEICNNQTGIINNDKDNISGEIYNAVAIMNGGNIYGNTQLALLNKSGAKFIIPTNSEAVIEGKSEGLRKFSNNFEKAHKAYVIWNETSSKLTIKGGSIISKADNEVAIGNDGSGDIEMTDGQISVSGKGSVAIANGKSSTGTVKLLGGSIHVTGEDSQILDNQGKIEVNDNLIIEKNGETPYVIAISCSEGGTATVSPETAIAGAPVQINVVADTNGGYVLSDIKLDGEPISDPYKFTASRNHNVTVTFMKKGSSGGSSGGSSSGSSKASTGTSQPTIPQTPGSWAQDTKGWKFVNTDGTNYLNTWIYIKSNWYRVGADGYMVQGWVALDGNQYYLNPVSGEMKTGWVQVNEKWYYLNADGKMAVNTTTPDGYKVGADGTWS